MSNRLNGKVAVITGGAKGLGLSIAEKFHEEGCQIIICDILSSEAKKVAKNLKGKSFELDVSDSRQVLNVFNDINNLYNKIDILVNNAGLSGAKGRAVVEETTLSNWNDVFAVNSTAIMLGTRAVIPHMRNVGGGSIINVSSIFGIVGSPAGAAYHASKGAARTFSKGAAVQYGKDKIRVNSIHPGFTDTPMTLDIHSQEEIRDYRLNMTPLGRLGLPEDIAYGILYLASDESSWVTGTELIVDGGETAW